LTLLVDVVNDFSIYSVLHVRMAEASNHHFGIISTFLIILNGTMKDHHQWSIDFNTNHCIKTGMKLEYIWDNQSCVD